MSLNVSNINSVYSLGKDKKTGDWYVGQWTNQALWKVDGSSKKICSFKEMTYWRYFREVVEHSSSVELEVGDRVAVPGKRGSYEWYYVIYSTESKDGKFQYVVGT